MSFIDALEKALGIVPMQAGDVYATWAVTEDLFKTTGYRPAMSVEQGVQAFVDWYKNYYNVQ